MIGWRLLMPGQGGCRNWSVARRPRQSSTSSRRSYSVDRRRFAASVSPRCTRRYLRAFRGLSAEAVALIDEADARLDAEPDRWAQAWIDWVRSGLVNKAGDPAAATALLRRSVAGSTAEGDQCAAGIAAIRLGELAELRGDYEEATSATLLAYNTVMVAGSKSFNASMLATRLGNLAALQGQFEEAAMWHERGLSRARDNELPGAIAQAFSGMGEAARRAGDLAAANSYHREALARFEASGSVEGAVFSLACLGLIATSDGDPADGDRTAHRQPCPCRRKLRPARCGDGGRRTCRRSRDARRGAARCPDPRRGRRASRRDRRRPSDVSARLCRSRRESSPVPNSTLTSTTQSMPVDMPTPTVSFGPYVRRARVTSAHVQPGRRSGNSRRCSRPSTAARSRSPLSTSLITSMC